MEYIKDVSTWESGGRVALDLAELKDGRVFAISDELIVLYGDMEDLLTGDPSESRPRLYLAD
jgi:hypothetical protein